MESVRTAVKLVVVITALAGGCAGLPYTPSIDPADFSVTIGNPLLPLVPGTTLAYEGEKKDGLERNEFVVTHETRVVMGVTCRVVRDTVQRECVVIEATDDWLAQDASGNVWYFGEDSKDYENGWRGFSPWP